MTRVDDTTDRRCTANSLTAGPGQGGAPPATLSGENGPVLGHVGVNVPDLGEAAAYYRPLMPLLRYEPFLTAEDALAYMPAGSRRGAYVFFYQATDERPYTREATGLQHLAFVVPTRGAVHDVHTHVVQAGSTVVHPPQEWPQYPPPYFAAFWLDPFGIMLEAVCHHDRD
jgi:catechol 2,3-dioxygenase-like lactoylglutathione lyase family enzyme